jgi:hypothetical protein
MTEYWFKPKTYGYGASPTNWKGWAATLCFGALVALISLPLMVAPALGNTGPTPWQLIAWLIALLALTIGFIRLCQAKTDGPWKWRWGKGDQ